jgi:hypothetical protein
MHDGEDFGFFVAVSLSNPEEVPRSRHRESTTAANGLDLRVDFPDEQIF